MSVKTGIIVATLLIGSIVGLVIYNETSKDDPAATTAESINEQPQAPSEPETEPKTITLAEVANHNSASDCWMIVRDKVYDVTDFIARHPGGSEIVRGCGINATSLFESRTTENGETVGTGSPHSSSAASQLEQYEIGTVSR